MIKLILDHWLAAIQAVAVIAASITAIYGVNSWRRELKGKRQYDMAEEALALFYNAKDTISAIRSPFGNTSEGQSRPTAPGESTEKKEALDKAYVPWERYLKHMDTFNRLRTLRYRFMAVFGKDSSGPFDSLEEVVRQLAITVHMLGYYWHELSRTHLPRTNEQIAQLEEGREKYEAIYWEGMRTPDPINEIVNSMIIKIEEICVPVLSRK